MYTIGNEQSHAQDLGAAGSCVKSFSSLPFMTCSLTSGGCKYAQRNDYSYWLAGDVTPSQRPVSNQAIEPFISKCVVCESSAIAFAVHSQDTREPDCPSGFESMWTGNSFLMAVGKGAGGAGQDLSSTGSCLSKFIHSPTIECQGGRGTCSFYADKFSFWLTVIRQNEMFDVPRARQLSVTRGREVMNAVSRCRVCTKRR